MYYPEKEGKRAREANRNPNYLVSFFLEFHISLFLKHAEFWLITPVQRGTNLPTPFVTDQMRLYIGKIVAD